MRDEGRLPDQPPEDRRQFLKAAGVLGAGLAASLNAPAAVPPPDPVPPAGGSAERQDAPAPAAPAGGDIPRRPLGRTGVQVSCIGVVGHHLGDIQSVDVAIRLVHEAIDAGINFFDNCWEYWNGKSEDWLGRALKDRRQRVFLMTKACTHGRSARVAMKQLEQSLRRLQTDHLDLWQIHAITYDNDPELAYARGGVLEAFDQAKRQGKVRFVGFTGHKDPALHLRMLQLGYRFDTVQMPLNVYDASFRSFERQVLPEVNRRRMAALGMKSLGGTPTGVQHGLVTAEEALRYAMSLPVATTICGIDSLEILRQNVRIARGFRPLSDEQMQALRTRVRPFTGDGHLELYKVSLRYDNPVTRMPHGFPIDPSQREVKAMFEQPNGTWETL
jgi:aryl-alcohol dehydrogenase-like predicted oxidoreductase